MEHKVIGTTMPVLEMQLQPGEAIIAESGELSWMTSSIELETSTQKAGAKGVFGALKRSLGGGTLFMTEYTAVGAPGMVAFATKVPGLIMPIEVSPGVEYMVHKSGFLCGASEVEVTMGFQKKFGAGMFGGAGFILQKVAGTGSAWVELDGELVTYDLAAGESMRVHPGHVGMFEARVAFELDRIEGVKNILFGGNDLFLARLTGPGKVWLQTLPLPNLAAALDPYIKRDSGSSSSGISFGGSDND